MSHDIYRYAFSTRAAFAEVLATFDLARIAVESLYGETRARMDTRFASDRAKQTLVIDASTAVGEALNQIFTGYVRREFGEDAFVIEHVDRSPTPVGAAA